MELGELLPRLTDPRRKEDHWEAQCPACQDRGHHLSVSQGDLGILVNCFKGCDTQDILAELGLTFADLFSNNDRIGGPRYAPGAPVQDPVRWFTDYCGVPAAMSRVLPIEAAGDRLVFRFGNRPVRKLRKPGTRDMLWEPAGANTPPLWPQPEATLPEIIWITEGESDAVVARYVGLWAYSLTRGAKATLSAEQAAELYRRGVRRVNLIPDADDAGGKGVAAQIERLAGAEIMVTVVRLAAVGLVDVMAGHKDLRDAWLACGDAAEFRRRLEEAADQEVDQNLPCDLASLPEPGPMEAVIDGIVARGYPSNLYGDSGTGKSYTALAMAASIVSGAPFLGRAVVPGRVLSLDWELNPEDHRRRWDALCRGLGYDRPLPGLFYQRMNAPLLDCLDQVMAWQRAIKPVLTIIDSAGKAMGDDPIKHGAAIAFYSALDRLGTVLVIDHQPKANGDTPYSARSEFGSAYKRNLARMAMQLEKTGGNDSHLDLVLRQKKNSFGPDGQEISFMLAFEADQDGREVARLQDGTKGCGTSKKRSAQSDQLADAILQALDQEPMTADDLALVIPDYKVEVIRNKVTELRKAHRVFPVEKRERAVVYSTREAEIL